VTDLDATVRLAQAGAADALEGVVAAVQDDVYRLCLRMTGNRDDALDATQETLIRVITRLSGFQGQAAFRTWVHRIAVNHLLDRKRSAVERHELTFDLFAADLHAGLQARAENADPATELLAREVKHGCTLALLTCLDRELRVAYVLAEVFGVSARDGAWICDTTEVAFRKRVSRARAAIRHFVGQHCGLVAGPRAECHCRRRVSVAVELGRVDPAAAQDPSADDVAAATAEMEALYDAAGLIRSLGDDAAPEVVAERIGVVIRSGRYDLLS
jgi:RNA polymerase sigma factor (sigma-70 family)